MVFGSLPLLASGGIAAKAYSNAQLHIVNEAFLPKAWHNLPAGLFFRDQFGVRDGTPAWVRQGIDESSECDDRALAPELTEAARGHGCRALVRATYVDTTETLVATIAVVVLDGDAESLYAEFDPAAEHPGQLANAYPVPGTPAADWTDEDRGGMTIGSFVYGDKEMPFLRVVTIGYLDGRAVEELPEPWRDRSPGTSNERSLDRIAAHVSAMYKNSLWSTIKELSR
jgi:hypothetical protein